MSPIILYQPNETNFTSNGLGVLNDATSAIVTEERNGVYELVIKYPVTGKRFADITYSSIIRCLTTPQGNYQTFRVYSVSKPINGIVTIHAEHISYQLSYIATDAFTAGTAAEAMARIKINAMSPCPFEFWTDKQTHGTYTQEVPENIRARLGGVRGSILDTYGGEYEFDNYNVKLHENRGTDRGVSLRYGKNITNIEQEENIGSTYTSIVGYWKSQDIVIKTNVINSTYASSYPFTRTKVVDLTSQFQEQPTVAQLEEAARSYMNANGFGIPHVNIKVSFAALWQTEEYKNIAPLERVYLCDTVSVFFEELGINASAKVVKTIYNALLDRYDAIELGEAKANLGGRLASQAGNTQQQFNDTKSELEASIDRATELITGNRGGHIVTRLDANEKPVELLIMDTDDVETATNVWRFNLSGWGFSSTGINGQYRLAATQDGHIVADFIDTGTLTANIIRAGVLQDSGGNTVFNLATGALTSKNLTIDSTYFKLRNDGQITSMTADGRKLIMNMGKITGYKVDGTQSAALEIGDGYFNIIGKLALNGVVGVSGATSFVKSIAYEEASLGNIVTGGRDVTVVTGISQGSASASASGTISFSGTCVVDGKTGTCSGTAYANLPVSVSITGFNPITSRVVEVGNTANIKYAKAVSASTGAINSADGLIQSIS